MSNNQLFQEIYSSYYTIISNSITRMLRKPPKNQSDIVRVITAEADNFPGFTDAAKTIAEIFTSSESGLFNENQIQLHESPSLPLTTIEKRWLKALLLDPKIQLFDVSDKGLEDVEPLFYPETIVYYDQYNDGDDYSDSTYKNNFQILLDAIHDQQAISLTLSKNKTKIDCVPFRMEYDSKSDKFRVLITNNGNHESINVNGIADITMLTNTDITTEILHAPKVQVLTFELIDTKDALKRCMIHFSDFKKETFRLGDNKYKVNIYYDKSDERELIIRVLSFGPRIVVTDPPEFRQAIKDRLFRQQRNSN